MGKSENALTSEAVEHVHGLEFADPYRWLEDNDSEQVINWQKEQAEIASTTVKQFSQFGHLQDRVDHYLVEQPRPPRFAGEHWFRVEGQRVVMATTALDDGETIFDLQADTANAAAVLSWFSPSPNGKVLAVGICDDGSEHNTIRLIDIATGQYLPNPPTQILMDNWTGGVYWLPDNSGFYFSAFAGEPLTSAQGIFFYRLADRMVVPQDVPLPDAEPISYSLVTSSDDGRYHIVHQGVLVLRPVALLDTAAADAVWQPFITDTPTAVIGQVIDKHFVAITYVDAPRGRLVKIPLDATMPNDTSTWVELIPESNAVMRSMTRAGEYLYLHELVDTYSRVRVVDLNGTPIALVPLPDKAVIAEGHFAIQRLIPKGHPEKWVFSYSTFTQSWGIYQYHYDPAASHTALDMLSAPQVCIENAVIEDHWATSADGTRVPYHCVRLQSVAPTVAQPALLYAYGAFNVLWKPEYPGAMAAFIEAGGVYVHGHIRGGGELGMDWWYDGRMQNKQKGYQDLYAIAEDLIAKGRTSSQQLALTGRSNGGLMAGVALTQRPDLWRAVVPQVGLYDLIASLRYPYTLRTIADEFADPECAKDIVRMSKFSPYHLIKKGTAYPSVYITAGATDPRCAAWQSRKFAARLQVEGVGNNQVLVHIWDNAGHGEATTKSIAVLQYTEWLAFILQAVNETP